MRERIQQSYSNGIKRWKRIIDRRKLEHLYVQWQNKHFLQANETSFATTTKMEGAVQGSYCTESNNIWNFPYLYISR